MDRTASCDPNDQGSNLVAIHAREKMETSLFATIFQNARQTHFGQNRFDLLSSTETLMVKINFGDGGRSRFQSRPRWPRWTRRPGQPDLPDLPRLDQLIKKRG